MRNVPATRDATQPKKARLTYGEAFALGALLAACLEGGLTTSSALASQVWIAGEARYNLRRAPGAEYRAIDLVKSGDEVTLLEEALGWTKVRTSSGSEGWIDSEHIQKEAPPLARIAQLESELAATKQLLAKERQTIESLRGEVGSLETRTDAAEAEQARLAGQAETLRSDARWREWAVGASIVLFGMLLGAILHRTTARRTSQRIRF